MSRDARDAISANRDLLVLLDRQMDRVRQHRPDLAVATRDINSFLPAMLMVRGTDEQPGIPIAFNAVDEPTGTIRVPSDASFVVTGVDVCGQFTFGASTFTGYGSLNADGAFARPLGLRFRDLSNNRYFTPISNNVASGNGGDDFVDARLLSRVRLFNPPSDLAVETVLARNTAVRVDVRTLQVRNDGSPRVSRLYVVFHGYKVFGEG